MQYSRMILQCKHTDYYWHCLRWLYSHISHGGQVAFGSNKMALGNTSNSTLCAIKISYFNIFINAQSPYRTKPTDNYITPLCIMHAYKDTVQVQYNLYQIHCINAFPPQRLIYAPSNSHKWHHLRAAALINGHAVNDDWRFICAMVSSDIPGSVLVNRCPPGGDVRTD